MCSRGGSNAGVRRRQSPLFTIWQICFDHVEGGSYCIRNWRLIHTYNMKWNFVGQYRNKEIELEVLTKVSKYLIATYKEHFSEEPD